MPIQHTEVKEARSGDFNFTVLPEDFYQVVVKDIDEKDVQVYGKAEGVQETKYIFKFAVLDEGEFQGIPISDFVLPKWFSEIGKTNKDGKPITPSKLVTLFKAFYGFYNPKINVFDMSKPSMQMVNDLIGKQVRIAVKVKGDEPKEGEEDERKNKISEYMVVKEELKIPDTIKVATMAAPKASTPVKEVEEKKESTGFIEGLEADKAKKESQESPAATQTD